MIDGIFVIRENEKNGKNIFIVNLDSIDKTSEKWVFKNVFCKMKHKKIICREHLLLCGTRHYIIKYA